MKLSIIIVNYKSWSSLQKCLDSIYKQSFNNYHIIVVDNFSDDGIAQTFCSQHPTVDFIFQDFNGGFAQACNIGASRATSEYVLFLNPDTIFTDQILQPLLEKIDHALDWKIVGIHQRNIEGKPMYPFGLFLTCWNVLAPVRSLERLFFRKQQSKSYLNTTAVGYPDWISGSFILMRKNDFEQLGGWDERFWMYCEDMDLSKRAADKNWKRVLYNELSIVHQHGGSSRINLDIKAKTKWQVIKSKQLYIQKHLSGLCKIFALIILNLSTYSELLLLSPFSTTKRKMLKMSFTE